LSNNMRQLSKQLLITALVMLSFGQPSVKAFAQKATNSRAAQSDRELLLAQDEEIRYLTAKVAALEKVDRGNRELVDSLQALVDGQAKALATCKAAIAKGDQISNIDDKLFTSLQASLTDAQKQISRLEGKVAFWRRAAGFGVVAAVGIGIAIGIAISK
jgi:hypothetical protein